MNYIYKLLSKGVKSKIAISSFGFFLLVFMSSKPVFAQIQVPPELAEFVAIDQAKNFYPELGEMDVYDIETYYDLDGNPAVYAIVLMRRDSTYRPSLEHLKDNIRRSYSSIKTTKQSIEEIKGQPISGKAKSKAIASKREEIREAQSLMIGKDFFVTVICSAKESNAPVLKLFKGLPEHLVIPPGFLDKQNIRDVIPGNSVKRTFYLGMFDLAFEFDTPENVRALRANGRVHEVLPLSKLVHSRSGKVANASEIRTRIIEKKEAVKQKRKTNPSAAAEESSRQSTLESKWGRTKARYEQYLREKVPNSPGEEGR